MHVTPEEVAQAYTVLAQEIDKWTAVLWEHSTSVPGAEESYRLEVAKVWKEAPPGDVRKGGMSEAERKAWVEGLTAAKRKVRDQHQQGNESALEIVRAIRAKLSGLQTIVNYFREEMGLAKYGPDAF